MNIMMGGVLFLFSTAMIVFSFRSGYVPVSRPIYRVHRDDRPAYFWTLISGYVFVGVAGLYISTH